MTKKVPHRSPDEWWIDFAHLVLTDDVLRQIPERERRWLILRWGLDGAGFRKHIDIQRVLGCGKGTVSIIGDSALAHVKRIYRRRGVTVILWK